MGDEVADRAHVAGVRTVGAPLDQLGAHALKVVGAEMDQAVGGEPLLGLRAEEQAEIARVRTAGIAWARDRDVRRVDTSVLCAVVIEPV